VTTEPGPVGLPTGPFYFVSISFTKGAAGTGEWWRNEDVGFVRPRQGVKLKLAAYPFQKHGLVEGEVIRVGADASEPTPGGAREAPPHGPPTLSYRAVVVPQAQALLVEGKPQRFAPGMQVSAEINLGSRTVLEYLLSPVQKAVQEAGRER